MARRSFTARQSWAARLTGANGPSDRSRIDAQPHSRSRPAVVPMRIAEFHSVTPSIAEAELPCRLELRGRAWGSAVLAVLLLPLALLPLAAMASLTMRITADADVRTLLASHPGSAAQVAIGLALILLLVVWPLAALIGRIGRRQTIVVGPGEVHVIERSLFGTRTWSHQTTYFLGLVHHVRTTHDGIRHELILLAPERRQSVLLAIAPGFTDAELAILAGRLGTKILPANALYERTRKPLQPRFTAAPERTLAVANA